MNKLIPLLAFSILLLVPAGTQQAYAITIESNGSGGGLWHVGTTWKDGVVPTGSENIIIKNDDIVTITTLVTVPGTITVESNGQLIITLLTTAGQLFIEGTLHNFGKTDINAS